MSAALQSFGKHLIEAWNFSRSWLSAPKPCAMDRLPKAVLEHLVSEYLSPREQHLFREVSRATRKLPCTCSPLCKLVSGQFKRVLYEEPFDAAAQEEATALDRRLTNPGRTTAFYYNRNLGRVFAGIFSDYCVSAPVNVFNAEGEFQYPVLETYFNKSVIAIKQIDDLLVALDKKIVCVWDATTGNQLKLIEHNQDPMLCVFSETRCGVFVVPYGSHTTVGFMDLKPDATRTIEYMGQSRDISSFGACRRFNEKHHKESITWIREDPYTGHILCGCNGGIITIWDQEFKLIRKLEIAEAGGNYLYLPSQQLLFASIGTSTIEIWDVITGTLKKKLLAQHELAISPSKIGALTWDAKKERLYACWFFKQANETSMSAFLSWDIESGMEVGNFLFKNPVSKVHYWVLKMELEKTKENLLCTQSMNGLQFWNLKTGELVRDILTSERFKHYEWDQELQKIFLLLDSIYYAGECTLSMIDYRTKV